MTDDKNPTTDDDRPPVHMDIVCNGAIALVSLKQDGEEVFWVELTKVGARRWGEALLRASDSLDLGSV